MKYIVDIDNIELNENNIYDPLSYPHEGLFVVTVRGATMGEDKRKEIMFVANSISYNMSAGNTNAEKFFKPMEETLNATEAAAPKETKAAEEAPQTDLEYLLRLIDVISNKRSYKDTII